MKLTTSVTLVLVLGVSIPGHAKKNSKPTPEKKKQECKAKDLVCNYIVATRKLLADYQTAIRGQIDSAERSYSATAQAAEQGKHDEVESSLNEATGRRL